MGERFNRESDFETKEQGGTFEDLIKKGEIKTGDFVWRGDIPSVIIRIEGSEIEFLGLDDIGIHDDPDLTESNISEISELNEDFKNGELKIMSKSEADQLIKSGIEDLEDLKGHLVVKEKTIQQNADIIKERLEYLKSLAKSRGIRIKE